MSEDEKSPLELFHEQVTRVAGEHILGACYRACDDYGELHNITITDTDKKKIIECVLDELKTQLLDDDMEELIDDVLKESGTDYAVPG